MSKELEALKRMAEYRFEEYGTERDDETSFDEDFEIIEQALIKAQKQKKVLDIIKEHPFASASTINYIKINKDNPNMLDYEHYCMTIDIKYRVNEEKFNLLKEMLI